MANTSGQSNVDAQRDDKELNFSDTGAGSTGGGTRKDSEPHIQPSETEGKSVNPGRTPGKAEGVEDSEERGNQ